jgi:tRNA(His) 5'-end guanylyltransferase
MRLNQMEAKEESEILPSPSQINHQGIPKDMSRSGHGLIRVALVQEQGSESTVLASRGERPRHGAQLPDRGA